MDRFGSAQCTIPCRYLGKEQGNGFVTYRFDVGDLVLRERKYGFFQKLWEARHLKKSRFKLILSMDLGGKK